MCGVRRTARLSNAGVESLALSVHADEQLHLGMNTAQDAERAGYRKSDVGLAARLLIAGVEAEPLRIHVGVVQQVAVIVNDLHRLPAPDGNFAGLEGAPLLRHLIER